MQLTESRTFGSKKHLSLGRDADNALLIKGITRWPRRYCVIKDALSLGRLH